MLARKVTAQLKVLPKLNFSSSTAQAADEGKSNFIRKAVSFVLITATGGVALSALDDLAIYHACSSKAMEKAGKDLGLRDAIGEPIEKGPWYNATLAVAHKRHSASCTFPVSGPRGNGILQLKAVRSGDDSWLAFIRPRDWEILIMEALLHVPENEEKTRTFRITISDKCPQLLQPAVLVQMAALRRYLTTAGSSRGKKWFSSIRILEKTWRFLTFRDLILFLVFWDIFLYKRPPEQT